MDIITNYHKYQDDEVYRLLSKKIKLVQGYKEKILDFYIPTIVLFGLDRDYFSNIVSNKWKDEGISYGIDEQLESFEGFELFIRDYMSCNNDIKILPNVKLNNERYLTSMRFNKNIYKWEISELFECKISDIINKKINVINRYVTSTVTGKYEHREEDYCFCITLKEKLLITINSHKDNKNDNLTLKIGNDYRFIRPLRYDYATNFDKKYENISVKGGDITIY